MDVEEKPALTLNHTTSEPLTSPTMSATIDADALALATMGYTPALPRSHTILSVLGLGFSLTNSWFAISVALITGINSGGPVLLIYGIILIFLISICVGISLSELASAYPNAGGQYFWASELSSGGGGAGEGWKRRDWGKGVSYVTGWCAWAGSIFTSASVALAVASAGVGCWQLGHPDL